MSQALDLAPGERLDGILHRRGADVILELEAALERWEVVTSSSSRRARR